MNTQPIQLTETLGDIVSRYPGSIPILTKHEVDFCCGGHRALATALNLPEDAVSHPVLSELQAGFEKALVQGEDIQQFKYENPVMLMDYIVHWHHERLRQNLPAIAKLLPKLIHVHGDNHPELSLVEGEFNPLMTAMMDHLADEENHSFPLIKEASETGKISPDVTRAINALRDDHDDVGNHLKALRKHTNGFQLPEDGCATYAYVYQKLQELEADTFQHVHLENNILFHMIG